MSINNNKLFIDNKYDEILFIPTPSQKLNEKLSAI